MPGYEILSDQHLIGLLKEGDHTAYTEIYNRYHHLMLVHAYKKLRDDDLAKDMVHDLFASIWFKRDQVLSTACLAPFLYTSLKNQIINYFIHKSVEAKYIASLKSFISIGNNANTDHRLRENEFQAYIDKQIQSLPPKMREIFELSRKSNLTYKEIAGTLSLSEKTVHSQMVNALGRLRTKLGLFSWLLF